MGLLVTIFHVENDGYLRLEEAGEVVLKEVEMGVFDAHNRDSRVDNNVTDEDDNASDDDSNGDDGAEDGCKPDQGMGAASRMGEYVA